MTKEQLAKLLGRPLTPTEISNLDLYLDIAKESLEELLCISLGDDTSGDPEEYSQTFDVREGYSTVFTGIFTEVSEVKVDGIATEDCYPAFWDKRSNPYYNSIVLGKSGKTAEITAVWGFDTVPNDLKLLWAQMFALVSKKRSVTRVKSKRVEDFSIAYADETEMETFKRDNALTIRKYSLCLIGNVQHGGGC